MMVKDRLEKYDVVLQRLTEDKIEMVRNWRNDPKISQYMEFRDYISPAMQAEWFKKVNNDYNLYFIIEFHGEEIGLINIKDLDYERRIGESGVFIYEDKYLNSDISYRAHLCLFDYYFLTLEFSKLYAHVLVSNKRAHRFCEFLGYEQIDATSLSLSKESYLANRYRERFVKKFNILNSRNND